MNKVLLAVPLSSLSLGPGGDGIAVILGAPDQDGAEKLLALYPPGTRVQNVPIVVQIDGITVAVDPVVTVDRDREMKQAQLVAGEIAGEVLADFSISTFGARRKGENCLVLIGVPDEHVAVQVLRRYPEGTRIRGVPVVVDIVGGGAFQETAEPLGPSDREFAKNLGEQMARDVALWPPRRRPTIGLSRCNAETLELNDGAQDTETVPCLKLYAPSEEALNELVALYGLKHQGVPLVYEVSGQGPARPLNANDENCDSTFTKIGRRLGRLFR